MRAHTHTHIWAKSHVHTHAQTREHAYMRTLEYANKHTRTHDHANAWPCTKCIRKYKKTHVHVNVRINTHALTYTHKCTNTCTHAHAHKTAYTNNAHEHAWTAQRYYSHMHMHAQGCTSRFGHTRLNIRADAYTWIWKVHATHSICVTMVARSLCACAQPTTCTDEHMPAHTHTHTFACISLNLTRSLYITYTPCAYCAQKTENTHNAYTNAHAAVHCRRTAYGTGS
jgi:hypothetical protein